MLKEKIVALLRSNARLSADRIAAELSVETSEVVSAVNEMEKSGVIVVPGTAFGSLGEGYVRFALVLPADELANLDFSGMGEMYGKL